LAWRTTAPFLTNFALWELLVLCKVARHRLKLPRERPGHLEAASSYLERLGHLEAGSSHPGRSSHLEAVSSYLARSSHLEAVSSYLGRSSHLEAASSYLERPRVISSRAQVISSGRDVSSRLKSLGSRVILSPLRMTRSAQDDSVRYETSHVSRHCKARATARHVTQPNPSTIERELPFLMKRPATNLGLTVANLSSMKPCGEIPSATRRDSRRSEGLLLRPSRLR